ncbi:MAG: rhomboid family intramembrane serine protease, partial [Planctomycetota bacterium]
VAQEYFAQMGIEVEPGKSFEIWALENFAHERFRVWEGEYWRLLTSSFLHGNLLHIVLNTVGLIYVGRIVERWLGTWRFLGAFFFCALVGSLFFQAKPGFVHGVGASGGIFGLFGVFSVGIFARAGRTGPVMQSRFWGFLGMAVVLVYAEGFLGELIYWWMGQGGVGVAVSVHLGGFAAGLLIGYLRCTLLSPEWRKRRDQAILATSVLTVVIAFYALVYPFADWSWFLWQAKTKLQAGSREGVSELYDRAVAVGGDGALDGVFQLEADLGDIEHVQRTWEESRFSSPAKKIDVGYRLAYDALAAEGHFEEGNAILAELIEIADRSIEEEYRSAESLNLAAWLRAKRGTDLDTALKLAEEACELERHPFHVHTLGWILYLQGEGATARQLLTSAAFEVRAAPFYLYLGLAYQEEDTEEALKYLELAYRADQSETNLSLKLGKHEHELLKMAEASLRAG